LVKLRGAPNPLPEGDLPRQLEEALAVLLGKGAGGL